MRNHSFNSVQVLRQYLQRHPVEIAVDSNEFTEALRQDFHQLGTNVDDAEAFFNKFSEIFRCSPLAQIQAWERILSILSDADSKKYKSLHKGTPFYFLGVASYLSEDFERAMFYMDCALSDDYDVVGGRWHGLPAGRFIRLADSERQHAQELVKRTRRAFDCWGDKITGFGGTRLTIEGYRMKLVNYAMHEGPSLRSAVTAFLSFLLEVSPRLTQLRLAPSTGSGEPFFLHLFKGGLIFETLLKQSDAGKTVMKSKPNCTLNDLLCDESVYKGLGFKKQLSGLGVHTFDGVVAQIHSDASCPDRTYDERAIRAVWGLRNATGHNLAWPKRPTIADYKMLFGLVLGALMLVVEKLYRERRLNDGTA